MDILKVFAVFVFLEVALHPTNDLKTFFQDLSVKSGVEEDVSEHSFAARAGQECFICRNDWIPFFAVAFAFDQAGVEVFSADLKELEFAPVAVHWLEKSVDKEVHVFDVQFMIHNRVQDHAQSIEFYFTFCELFEVSPDIGCFRDVGRNTHQAMEDHLFLQRFLGNYFSLELVEVDRGKQLVVEVVAEDSRALMDEACDLGED